MNFSFDLLIFTTLFVAEHLARTLNHNSTCVQKQCVVEAIGAIRRSTLSTTYMYVLLSTTVRSTDTF